MRETFVRTLLDEAKREKDIVLITGDLGFGVLEKFESELPSQFLNAGVAEQSMLGLAAGMASTGKRVFVYSIGNFPTIRALEQIRNDICYMDNSVVIVSVGSGYSYGSQGYTHHALEDIAVMRALPNMEIYSPADSLETESITRDLTKSQKPSYLRLGRSGERILNQSPLTLQKGRFNQIQSGKDGTILFTGSIGSIVMDARELLLAHGIEVGVISIPYVSSISKTDLELLDGSKPVVSVEEHTIRGGLSSALLEQISTFRLNIQIIPVTAEQNNLNNIGDQNYLRNTNGLSVQHIATHFIES
jgi:transketolase